MERHQPTKSQQRHFYILEKLLIEFWGLWEFQIDA